MSSLLETAVLGLCLVVFIGPLLARIFMRSAKKQEIDSTFQPTVTVVTPMFNEGESIRGTIRSILAQNYPVEKINVIVVDDCSTDDSYEHAIDEIRTSARAVVLRNDINMGKRCSINRAVRESTTEIIVSVNSDVILEPNAVKNLVRRFTSPSIAAVGGRVDILNKRDNWLTRMQSVKYYYGYHFLKNVERAFRKVMCLSGCLTAYRRHVLVELEPILEQRNILGVPIKYGEDRFLTRQIIKAGYQTTMTTDAVCRTVAPSDLHDYFAQQLRWRRSNIVDYVGGSSHVWRVHSVVAIHYYSVFALFLAYPALLMQSLIAGTFWSLMTWHVGVVFALGLLYRFHVRRYPAEQRVSALDFIPMAIILPVSYAVLTPLALLTLDSGKWETRGHVDAPAAEPVAATAPAAPRPVEVVRPVESHARVEAIESSRSPRRTRRAPALVKTAPATEKVAARLNRTAV